MIKNRLLEAGVGSLWWPSQLGFIRGFSTEDAVFVARRRIELARAQRNGGSYAFFNRFFVVAQRAGHQCHHAMIAALDTWDLEFSFKFVL